MQLFKSIRKTQLTILSALLISGVLQAQDPIGDIVESTGVGQIVRNNEQFGPDVGGDIFLYDEAETVNGRMKIEFLDEEELDLIEHTVVYIDEVYYDPNPSLSKMSLRMVQGTARFASGKGNKIKKANIDISTPTSQIAINGTDFTTTIDELGRTLVILLPDITGASSGEIRVYNQGGETILNQPYQATMVSSLETPPTRNVIINNITASMIDNMFIVNPPQEVKQAIEDQVAEDQNEDSGILDVDFLEFNELESDELEDSMEEDFSELDIDLLDVDFLTDLLDVVEELDKKVRGSGDSGGGASIGNWRVEGAVQGFNKDSQFNVFEQDGDLYLYRNVNGTIEIIIASGGTGFLDVRVEGYEGVIEFGGGDPNIQIFINQTN